MDYESSSELLKEIWNLIDEDGDKKLTDLEFTRAMGNIYKEIRRKICALSYFLCNGRNMSGVYWVDDETIHYLKEKKNLDDTKYWIGYSTKFIFRTN